MSNKLRVEPDYSDRSEREVPTLARSFEVIVCGSGEEEPISPELDSIPISGEIIGGVYQVIGEIGKGGMGIVLAALDQHLGRKVAIKLIRSNLSASYFRTRFLVEARAMAEVNHPNVLAIYAFGQHGSAPYFVMEYMESTLERVIAEQGRRIHVDLALELLSEICAGVQAMHDAKTLHRDLKPANILLDSQLHVRVGDLGMAQKLLDGKGIREFVGTPGYIAPELVFGGADGAAASPQSDVYSLGCIAYELLTGQPPHHADLDCDLLSLHASADVVPPTLLRPDLPETFDSVILAALTKDPTQRTSSAARFSQELQAARRKSLEPSRILVAEDEPDFRDLLELKLKIAFPDAEVECVSDGQAAVAAFENKPASVVILDLQMPVIDGVAATVLLRARPAAAKVPILVLTASGGPQEWKLLSSLGADRFLIKPVDLDDLVTLVRRTVKLRQEQQDGSC
ncbi:MAG: protein kinase [Polyangiaceae bacterium]